VSSTRAQLQQHSVEITKNIEKPKGGNSSLFFLVAAPMLRTLHCERTLWRAAMEIAGRCPFPWLKHEVRHPDSTLGHA